MNNEKHPLILIETQANDDGLWFEAQTAPEAYLQRELRRLHAVVEDWFKQELKPCKPRLSDEQLTKLAEQIRRA